MPRCRAAGRAAAWGGVWGLHSALPYHITPNSTLVPRQMRHSQAEPSFFLISLVGYGTATSAWELSRPLSLFYTSDMEWEDVLSYFAL